MSTEKYLYCSPDVAARYHVWIQNRGGIAVWKSVDLSNPVGSWCTPALTEQGEPTPQPTWQAEASPSGIVTTPEQVMVDIPREVKRFRVGVRKGGSRWMLKVTEGGSRRIWREVAKAGEGAWYEFAYETQEAVIFVPQEQIPLLEYLARVAKEQEENAHGQVHC